MGIWANSHIFSLAGGNFFCFGGPFAGGVKMQTSLPDAPERTFEKMYPAILDATFSPF